MRHVIDASLTGQVSDGAALADVESTKAARRSRRGEACAGQALYRRLSSQPTQTDRRVLRCSGMRLSFAAFSTQVRFPLLNNDLPHLGPLLADNFSDQSPFLFPEQLYFSAR